MRDYKSLDNLNAGALRFRSHQDALNYANHSVENTKRVFASQRLDFVESYKKNDCECVLKYFGRESCFGEYEFVFDAIPNGGGVKGIESFLIGDGDGLGKRPKRDEREVLIGVTHLVYGPKNVIPSLVRLEPAKKRLDLWRQVLTGSFYVVAKVGPGVTKGKFGEVGVLPDMSESNSEGALIEGGSKIKDNIGGDVGPFIGGGFRKDDFVQILRSVRITINRPGPRLFVKKFNNIRPEDFEVMLCSREAAS